MKILKKLSDRKTWLFCIIPIIMFAVWFALMLFAYTRHIKNPVFIIIFQIPFITSFLLSLGYGLFLRLKCKNIKNIVFGIVGIAFLACFLGLQIAQLSMLPKLCIKSQEADELLEIYENTPYDDASYSQCKDEWRKVNKEASDLEFTITFLNLGSYLAISIATFCCPKAKQKTDKTDKSDDFSNLNTKI